MRKATSVALAVIMGMVFLMFSNKVFSYVQREGDRTYIVDRTGERWDITEAKSIGFHPELFQHGIGRNAFYPLDDSDLTRETRWVYSGLRVIGVSEGSEAKAYSIFQAQPSRNCQ